MEDFLGFIIVAIALISSLTKAAKKNQAQRTAPPIVSKAAPHPYQATATPPPVAKPSVSAPPPPAPVATMMPAREEQVVAPVKVSVHAHVEPDCVVHDAPGSLAFKSDEGKDPCHEAQFAPRDAQAGANQETSGLNLEWSGDGLVKAFVMQEVLTRPCQRRAAK